MSVKKKHLLIGGIVLGLGIIFITTFFYAKSLYTESQKQFSVNDFFEKHRFPTFQETTSKTTLIMTGDVMLGRTVEITTRESGDFNYPFLKVVQELKSADITFINLENPVINNCSPHTGGFIFCANPQMVDGLIYSGVDIVTLANNHTLNHAQRGLDKTVQILNAKSILTTGTGSLVVIEKNGTKFGFLGFDKAQLGNPQLTSEEKQLLEDANTQVDVLIVAMHWGVEYKDAALAGVKTLAKELVTGGADVVVGSHPHWVQDREYISKEGLSIQSERTDPPFDIAGYIPIYYSLGNFVFDQMWSEETKSGLAVRLTFDGKVLEKEELLPVYMKAKAQPEWVQ